MNLISFQKSWNALNDHEAPENLNYATVKLVGGGGGGGGGWGGGGGVLCHTEPENINYATVKFGGWGEAFSAKRSQKI